MRTKEGGQYMGDQHNKYLGLWQSCTGLVMNSSEPCVGVFILGRLNIASLLRILSLIHGVPYLMGRFCL